MRVLSETGDTARVCVTAVRDWNGIRMSFLHRDQAGIAVPERRGEGVVSPRILLSLELPLLEPILRNPTQRFYIIFLTLQSHALLGKISNTLSPRILVAGLFSGTVSKVLVKDINYELLFFIRTKKYFIY